MRGQKIMLTNPVVQEILKDITQDDENSNSIIECILNGTPSDLEISEETEIKLTTVRKILYKLYDAGLATCKKNKDPETNWFIYNWKFDPEKISDIITKKYGKFSEDIQRSIEYEEENMFFVCKSNGHRYKFEKASENNFICPKCGELMEYQDNSAIITELQNEKATYVSMGEIKD
jgi:transcription initiation factor TFIIE subunit alpha